MAEESLLQRVRRKRVSTPIPVPEAAQYGVFAPGYSGYLQATAGASGPTDSAALAAGNAAALRMNADAEAASYQRMLGRAQDLQIDAQKRDLLAEREGDVFDKRLEGVDRGMPNYADVEVDPVTGESRIAYNQPQLNLGAALGADAMTADAWQKKGNAVNSLTTAGVRPTKEALEHSFGDPYGNPLPMEMAALPSVEAEVGLGETAAQRLQRELLVEQTKAEFAQDEVQIKAVLNETGDQVLYEITGKNPERVEAAKQRFRSGGVAVKGDSPSPSVSPNAGAQGGGASANSATVVRGDLSDYRDVGYDAIENRLERKYNLPAGLMKRIRVYGERSNANAVSPTGARTVYQILPSTRKLFGDKYHIDAYAGPTQAAEIAALHLKESIDRGEDPVRGYNGGPKSGGRWNTKENNEYAARVNDGKAFDAARTQPGLDDQRIAKWKSLPQVADAKRNQNGGVTVTLKNGRTVNYINGRRQG